MNTIDNTNDVLVSMLLEINTETGDYKGYTELTYENTKTYLKDRTFDVLYVKDMLIPLNGVMHWQSIIAMIPEKSEDSCVILVTKPYIAKEI